MHPGDMLKSITNVLESPRSDLNLEGRLSDPQVFLLTMVLEKYRCFRSCSQISARRRVAKGARRLVSQGSGDGHALARANSEGDPAASENSVIKIVATLRH